ncbi:MAG: hypothetical protein ACYTF5_18295, partial [Planctomycetota bacterium]
MGDTVATYTAETATLQIRGLAYLRPTGPEAVELHAIDPKGTVHLLRAKDRGARGTLVVVESTPFPAKARTPLTAAPRGLARFARPDGHSWFLTLEFQKVRKVREGKQRGISRLWWFDAKAAHCLDLSAQEFGLGGSEILGVAAAEKRILVSYVCKGRGFDPRRVGRGILVLQWTGKVGDAPGLSRHLPDSGQASSQRLAWMQLPEAAYLFGTVGRNRAYLATGSSGRGLFHFALPKSVARHGPTGLAYGGKDLWVASGGKSRARVHRINAYRNPYKLRLGPKQIRHLSMTIRSRPEKSAAEMGWVRHWFSRPQDTAVLPNQGILAGSERVQDLSRVENASVREHAIDPAGDRSCRQVFQLVEYRSGAGREYRSRYDIDCWTRSCRKYLYPHLVPRRPQPPAGTDYTTDYTADDPVLYNLKDQATYRDFIARVKAYITKVYDEPADMAHPYWAARNIVEYLQDHYYYPVREVGHPAAVDYDKGHYDANPGNAKIALSAKPYDKSQIIACSGTSVMVAGAMRHLGFSARWLGTAMEMGPKKWDRNGNRLLDPGERARCSNGHRLSQVWLGRDYGWVCFDGTPSRPPKNDFQKPPRRKNQWRFMERAAGGLRNSHRLVFNIGSQFIEPLYRDFEYDPKLAKDNNCGGDQRYNLQGRYEKPALWKLASHRIHVTSPCVITDIKTSGPTRRTLVTWKTVGPWQLAGDARLEIHLMTTGGK